MKSINRKWFKGETLEELKAEYKKLIRAHHPDLGGSEEDMAEINAEFDYLAASAPKTAADGKKYQPSEETREAPEAFRAAVLAVIHMQGVKVELCGDWLWCSGNTREYAEDFKRAGYKWSRNKVAWYWHAEGYRKHGKKSFTLDQIRSTFGSVGVTADAAPHFGPAIA